MERLHDFKAKDLQGKEVDLSQYKGKAVLVVNTASECGFTPQFEDLEELYKEYKPKGLEIIGFPSDDFGGQEPLEGEKIEEFCQVNYGVSFKMMNKVKVKGDDAADVYKFLSDKKRNGKTSLAPKWNFHKYLIDPDGKLVDYFLTITKPTSAKVKKAIEKTLNLQA